MRFTRSISFLNVGQRGEERRVESREKGGRDGKRAHKKPGMNKFSLCVPKTFDFCFFTLGP